MVEIRVEGLDALKAQLQGFSDRRFRAAVATALTRTAGAVRQQWRQDLQADIDRPTPLTRNAAISMPANAGKLQAEVFLREQLAGGGVAPAEYIGTQERGGDRRLKRFEQALVASGAMPAGMRAVPGRGARLDSFGNVSRAQIVQVLNQLGAKLSVGYQQVISRSAAKRAASAARAGRQYVAIPQDRNGLPAGIYARTGRGLDAVFFYARNVRYPRRTRLLEAGQRVAGARLNAELQRAIGEHMARLAKRGGR